MIKRNLIEIRGLEIKFQDEQSTFIAVEDVNFSINRGETLGIVGESGSGKSSTALAIMGLFTRSNGRITKGEISYNFNDNDKQDLAIASQKEMRFLRGNFISMVFQEPMTSLNPIFTCGEQVMEVILLHEKCTRKEAKTKTLELFSQVKISDPDSLFKRYPHQVSGGQKQRVMIAMAICCHPTLLIVDEPTTALDVTVQAGILDLLRDLQVEYNMAILFISHDLNVIAEIADRVMVMHKGHVVEEGSVSEIFSSPKHPYTKGLLACRPLLNMRLKHLPTVADYMSDNDGIKAASTFQLDELTVSAETRKMAHEKLYKRKPLLRVSHLTKSYKERGAFFGKKANYFYAVKNVSFDVYPGETLGLVGESGCGKSTLSSLILRLIEPTLGDVIFDGQNLNHLRKGKMRKLRKDIQLIFQDAYASLNPRMRVSDLIIEPMLVHGILKGNDDPTRQIMRLLTRVGLDKSFYNRYPHELSGGQRQRVCIARVLSLKPKLIILDESVSAVDVSVQAQVLNLLNELKEEFGFTYIFISHDLSVVKYISDRMLVMHKGQIVEIGEADEVYNNPQHPYTKELIASIPKGL